MKRLLLLLILLPSMLSAKNLADRWETVDSLMAKRLPRSVIEKVESIRCEALKADDFPQIVKASFVLLDMYAELSADSIDGRLNDIEKYLAELPGTAEKSVVHALLGDAYNRYSSRFYSDKDKYEKFVDLSKSHFEMSMNDWQTLSESDARNYSPLISLYGKDSRLFKNDLLSVISLFRIHYSGLSLDEQIELYDSLSSFYESKGNKSGAVFMKLQSFSMRLWTVGQKWHLTKDEYKDSLLNMIKHNKEVETVSDVYLNLIQLGTMDRKEKLHYLKEATEQCNDTVLLNMFRSIEAELNRKRLSARVERGFANSPLAVCLQHFGVDSCNISFYHRGKERIETSRIVSLEGDDVKEDTLYFILPPGDYRMDVCGEGLCDSADVVLSSMMGVYTLIDNEANVVTVVDGYEGKPVRKALLTVSPSNRKSIAGGLKDTICQSDMNGQAFFNKFKERTNVLISRGEFDETRIRNISSIESHKETYALRSRVYTDRSVYRPGQTVKVSSLIYSVLHEEMNVAENCKHTLVLRDANHRVVSQTNVKTNSMGSSFVEFNLPESGLTGLYSIELSAETPNGNKSGESRTSFRVEEYKRPTFYVSMDLEQTEYMLGDTVDFDGCAMNYNGTPIQNSTVAYTVEFRNSMFWYRRGYAWQPIGSGTLTTDENGMFTVPVHLSQDKMNVDGEIMEYRVTANVRNLMGETQSASHIVPVSRNTFGLNVEAPAVIRIDESSDSIMPYARNLQNKELCVSGEYIVRYIYNDELLKDCDGTNFKKRVFAEKKKEVGKGHFVSGKSLPAELFSSYKPGFYEIELFAEDTLHEDGKMKIDTVSAKIELALFSPRKSSFNASRDFFYSSSDKFSASAPADIYFKSKYGDIYVYWFAVSEKGLVEHGCERLKNKIKHFRYDYKPEYGDGISLSLFYVKDGEVHYFNKKIEKERQNKDLTLRWETFRDKLKPGQEEEWKLSVTDAEGKNVCAEVMATMYDSSLDAIYPHNWYFFLMNNSVIPNIWHYDNRFINSGAYCSLRFPMQQFNVEGRAFDEIIRMPFANIRMSSGGARIGRAFMQDGNALMLKSSNFSVPTEVVVEEETSESDVVEIEQDNRETVAVRENFSETAFFYPQLLSDENGNVTLKFTLPESLTMWNFMAFAHTKDMKHGMLKAKVTASKDFMLMSNAPRFLRADDRASVPVSIVNRTEERIEGEVIIKFYDYKSNKMLHTQKLPFKVESKQSGSVAFDFDVSWDVPVVVCQIEANGHGFSDGERIFIPVLGNIRSVTNAHPYFLDKGESVEIELSELFAEGSTDRKLFIEHYDNPVNYVFMALGESVSSKADDAVSLATAYFAQGVSTRLADSVPEIKRLIESLEQSEISLSAKESPLQKNNEFKEILLHESPWTNESDKETSRLHFLKNLVDKNYSAYILSQTGAKLSRLQNEDGSWSWFEGMPGNVYITMSVVERLAELETIYGQTSLHNNMQRAMEWLDREEMKSYSEAKKQKRGVKNNKLAISERTARYLYVSSLVKRTFTEDMENMINDYLKIASKSISNLTIYGRANIACAMNSYGMKSVSADFVRSLRQHTVLNRKYGRYFDLSAYSVTWCDYNMTAHLAAMKAMSLHRDAFSDTQTYLDEMLKWIVVQKRTQLWAAPRLAVNASEAMISYSSKLRPSAVGKNESGVLINGHYVSLQQSGSASIPELKDSIICSVIADESSNKTITLSHNSNQMVWGSVYAQSTGDIRNTKATSGQNPLRIKRTLYVERFADGATVWVENPDTVRVGEKVRIRYSLSADMGMDFIQIRASHPSSFEHVNNLSGTRWQGNTCAYVSPHDASTDIFFSSLPKGTLTFDCEMRVTRKGVYAMGTATAQSAYAPAFIAHAANKTIVVTE